MHVKFMLFNQSNMILLQGTKLLEGYCHESMQRNGRKLGVWKSFEVMPFKTTDNALLQTRKRNFGVVRGYPARFLVSDVFFVFSNSSSPMVFVQ